MGPVVQTTSGAVRGSSERGAHVFLNIPYAAPPFGARRFQAPAPPNSWEGIRDALAYGATAPQPHRQFTLVPEPVTPGDDCLNLNVFTPSGSGPGDALPVLFWIHGGGFTAGCNASTWYRGEPFAAHGVVTVSINYRLGAEGFLVLDGAPSNRAVLDWVAALTWVRENIAAFGGDPTKVTIAGQSAGGVACSTLLCMPAAKGLFRAAICMSGSRVPTDAAADTIGLTRAVADELGVDPTLRGLASVDPEQLVDVQDAAATRVAGAGEPVRIGFGPVVDDDVIPKAGLLVDPDVKVMAGATAEEFNAAMRGLAGKMDDERLVRRLGRMGVDGEATAAAYRAVLPDAENWWLYGQAVTDSRFKSPSDRLVGAWAKGGGDAWLYAFEWRSLLPQFGSVHCLDIPFAFDNLAAAGAREVTGEGAPQELADAMHGAFVGFIADGDPGWPAYDVSRRAGKVFDATSKVVEDPYRFERETWTRSSL
ncbi:MAG TPA: carboxylesterase family protein [Acidimicrobiales bacterium]|nr:carboxylesterase family protein [Acidimicrobiales bacterium]